jgi:hypothetical protein
MFDTNKFLELVETFRQQNPHWRYGQSLFNTLDLRYPSIADKVRGTDIDPYYASDDSQVITKFFEYVSKELNKNG